MSVDITIFDRADRFGPAHRTIDAALKSGVEWVAARVNTLSVDVVVAPTDFGRDQSLNAVTQGGQNISLGIDVACLDDAGLFENVRCCLVHELHHAHRWPRIPKWTVGECLILEGLAKIADIEAYRAHVPGAPMPGWDIADVAVDRREAQTLRDTARRTRVTGCMRQSRQPRRMSLRAFIPLASTSCCARHMPCIWMPGRPLHLMRIC